MLLIRYAGTLLDGRKLNSTRVSDSPVTFTLGQSEVYVGLDDGIVTMKRGEVALFTLPAAKSGGIPRGTNSAVQFEVELVFLDHGRG